MDLKKKEFTKQLYIVFLLNFFVLLFILKKYIYFLENIDTFLSKLFLILTSFSHFFLISALPLILSLLILLLTKSMLFTKIINIISSVFIILVVQIDATVFGQFRYHISPIVLKLVFGKRSSDIFQFSTVNIQIFIAVIIGIILLQFLFYYISEIIITKKKNLKVKPTMFFFIVALLFSHFVYAWSDANYYRPVTQFKNVFPAFFPLTADNLLMKMNLVDEDKIKQNKELTSDFSSKTVSYPLQTIVSENSKTKKNILFLIIDSWRFNSISKDISPNINALSKKCQFFNNHISASNMTTGGVFSLLYGIPATYFDTFTGQEIPPVFITEMQKQNYDMLIYGSSGLENPPFNRNVFAKIPNLRLFSKGENPSDRDLTITNEWMDNLEKRTSKNPFFGFLFYDSAHGFDYPKNYNIKFKPSLAEVNYLDLDNNYNPIPLFNRYLNSVNYVDDLIGKVINQLKNKGLLENTIIIITGDHGQEFNDNKKGYWEHGGNFSKYQINTPLLLFDATKIPNNFSHQTINYDITATLLNEYLHVKNKFTDYSFGRSLYETNKRDYFICGYNQRFAIVEKNKITNIYPSGLYDVTDGNLNILKEENINYELVTEGLSEMNRFYKKESDKK